MIFNDFHRKLEKHRITSGNKWSLSNFSHFCLKNKGFLMIRSYKSSNHWIWSSASSLNMIKFHCSICTNVQSCISSSSSTATLCCLNVLTCGWNCSFGQELCSVISLGITLSCVSRFGRQPCGMWEAACWRHPLWRLPRKWVRETAALCPPAAVRGGGLVCATREVWGDTALARRPPPVWQWDVPLVDSYALLMHLPPPRALLSCHWLS